MIRFRTLGGLDLHDSQGRELRAIFAASKGAALLTYLAIATPLARPALLDEPEAPPVSPEDSI